MGVKWVELLAIAAAAGVMAAVVMLVVVPDGFERHSDFLWSIYAARDWLAGRPVYAATPHRDMIPYPFTAALIAMPLAPLPIRLGVSLFVAGGVAALTLALTRGPFWRAGILVSSSCYIAVQTAQWSTWYTAALTFPSLLCLVVAKPQFALLAICRWPTRWAVAIGLLILAGSLVMLPGWPRLWLAQLGPYEGFIPITMAPWLALAAFRWRDPRARLLLVMACMPQHKYWYDQLPLYLIAATPRQMLYLLLCGWIGLGMAFKIDFQSGQFLISTFLYLPALIMIWKGARHPEPTDDPDQRDVWKTWPSWVGSRSILERWPRIAPERPATASSSQS
jgi:hypothetical protein